MKYLRFVGLLALGSILGTVSCQKEVKYKGDSDESLLVVNCLASNDSTFSITVERSVFFLESNQTNTKIDNATVTLVDNTAGATYTLSSGVNGVYDFGVPVQEGHSYSVSVAHSQYPTATASTYIPSVINVTQIDTATVFTSGGYEEMEVRLTWNDPVGKNYYLILVKEVYSGISNDLFMITSDPSVFNSNSVAGEESYIRILALDDSYFDGTEKTLKMQVSKGGPGTTMEVYLCHVTEDAYRYLISTEQQLSSDSGLFTEPVKIHSNINAGFGIFAGLTQHVTSIQL